MTDQYSAEVETLAAAYVYYVEAARAALLARYAADEAAEQERDAQVLLEAARTTFLDAQDYEAARPAREAAWDASRPPASNTERM